MATTDLFNNPNNDYVNPGLSPCQGSSDDAYFGIGNGNAEITSGSQILASLDFSNVKIGVSAWSVETKIIGEREVVYIPGLTKGLQKRQQGFIIPNLVSDDYDLNPYFLQVDLSINYYQNFRYTYTSIDASANYDQNLTIADALNIALGTAGISATATYDPSALTFTGTIDGYDFTISNVVLSLIDASENSSSPFAYQSNADSYDLVENPDLKYLYAKYPNGAVQGIVMKGIYPTTTPMTPYDKWLNIFHVSDMITLYTEIEIDNFITDIQKTTTITFDPDVTFGPFVDDVDVNVKDISCVSTGYTYDPSYGLPTYNATVDNSVLLYASYSFSTITNSIIEYSGISDFRVADPSGWHISDSSVYGSDLYDNNVGANDPDSFIENSFISESSINTVDVSGCLIQNSYVKYGLIRNSDIACLWLLEDTSILTSTISNFDAEGNDFYNSGISNMVLTSGGIYDSSILDSSIVSSTVSGSLAENLDVSLGTISDTYIKDSFFFESDIEDSSILNSVVNNASSITNSVFEGGYTNAYKLTINASLGLYEWVIDDPTLSIDDSSSRVGIQTTTIHDSSINNATIYDSSIYTSYLQDASLIRCTLYNVEVDSSSVTYEDCRIVQINMTEDCSITWDVDSSTYYQKSIKNVEVGMNGCSTDEAISAGDYLDWINTNNYWNKFGDMYVWTTAPDGCSDCHNLIDGFYVYNPHTFSVKIEYMLFI